MTARGLLSGLLLGLFVSVATYFNDWVIGQTQLIGNHLPVSIFGFAVVLLLGINPILLRFGRGIAFRRSEVALMLTLGLAACGWPGSNFYRGFTTVTALPAHWIKTNPSWQANHVLSYVPGASAELGQGHVQDWLEVINSALPPEGARLVGDAPSPGARIWHGLSAEGQRAFRQIGTKQRVELDRIPELTRSLNEALRNEDFYEPAAFRGVSLSPRLQALLAKDDLAAHDIVLRNRLLLAAAFPQAILPPPNGAGALVDGGRADPLVVDTLLQGRSSHDRLGFPELPWGAWWPTLRLWGLAALLLGASSLCLALIVHPQWSRQELLPYPIVRFIEETSERKPGSFLPEVAKNKLFWLGFGVLGFWHLVNGLHAWFPAVPEIPRNLDLWSLSQLFPNAVRVSGQYGWFGPAFYLSVAAFAFFLPTSVSFSLGVSHLLFFALGSVLLANGIPFDADHLGAKRSNLLRFGAYLGFAAIIAYTGSHYYKNVLAAALGRMRSEDTPPYAVWAARALGVLVVLTCLTLGSSGLGWTFSVLFVLLSLLTFVVLTRVVTETGAFFVQTGWSPVGVLAAVLGFESLGPTTFILLALASVLLVLDPREALMPFLANGLELSERVGNVPIPKVVPWVSVMLLTGFGVAGAVTLYLQYNHSAIQAGNTWGTHQLPVIAFDALSRSVSESAAHGTLIEATGMTTAERFAAIRPAEGALFWLTLGLVLVLTTAAARLRLPWWPLHPVAFLVWDTYPIIMFGASFLLGWMIKAAVVGTTGARGYHAVRPLMIGVIAGELLSALLWMGVGASYFFATGQRPVTYSVFPL